MEVNISFFSQDSAKEILQILFVQIELLLIGTVCELYMWLLLVAPVCNFPVNQYLAGLECKYNQLLQSPASLVPIRPLVHV
jgi:hypothetical protein